MMTYGLNLTTANDPLKKVSVEQVLQKIKHPSETFESQINRLRVLKGLDQSAYRKQKTLLPYFVCSLFHPLVRKKENFAAAYHMVIDIDHCLTEGISLQVLKQEISKDPEVRGIFISPGGDGLKVIFDFDERISDAALYSIIYKNYLLDFANKYALENVVDFVTHDVSRACFFSADRDAYINDHPKALETSKWIKEPNSGLFAEIEKTFKQEAEKRAIKNPDKTPVTVIEDDKLNEIKSKLFPKRVIKEKPKVYVPPELENIGEDLANHLLQFGMELKKEEPIQYGKKLRIEGGKHFAELNIFYGKKGYSIVKTPKTGSNEALAELAYEALVLFIQ